MGRLDRSKFVTVTAQTMAIRMKNTFYQKVEVFRDLQDKVDRFLNVPEDRSNLIRPLLATLRESCESDGVGIGLWDVDDFPCVYRNGFLEGFLLKDGFIDDNAMRMRSCRDGNGNAGLECVYEKVISGYTDPVSLFFTPNGSFLVNNIPNLKEKPESKIFGGFARNGCVWQGYGSIAMTPIRAMGRIVGVLQFGYLNKEHFTHETIGLLEGVGDAIGEMLLCRQTGKRLEFIKRSIDAAPDSACWMDPEGNFIHVNETACRSLGYSCDELLQMRLFDIAPGITGGRLAEIRENMRANKKIVTETDFRCRNGTEFPVEIIINRVAYDGQEYLCGFAQDITGRKTAQRRLQESEARFRATFEQAAVGIAHVAADGRFLRINQKFCDILGYSQVEMLERTFQDITHPDDLGRSLQGLHQLLDGEIDTFTVEKMYLHKDGHPVWVSLTASGVRNEAGEIGWFVSVVKDITERIQIEKALKESVARLAEAEEIGGCGSWSWEIESDHIEWSKGLYRLVGIDPQEDIFPYYSGHASLFTPESWKILDEGVQRAVQHGEGYELELNMIRTDGRVIDVLIRGFPIRNAAGQVVRLQGSVLDITRHNFMKHQLRESEKMARSLLNATHDITHLIDEDGIIIDINDAMVDALGGSREDLIGTCVFDRIPKASAEYRKEVMRHALREQKPVKCTDASSSSGKIYSTTVYPIKTLTGGKRQVVVFSHDVTEFEKAKNELKKSESRLREAQQIAHIGSWEHDLLTDTFTLSDEALRIFEIADPELVHHTYETYLAFVHPEDRRRIDENYTRSIGDRRPVNTTFRMLFPDGRIKFVHLRHENHYAPDGTPLRAVGTIQDLTVAKQAEIERGQLRNDLAHLSRVMTMTELAGSLAHEINQPLGAITNNASAARTMHADNRVRGAEIGEILDDIIMDATRAGEIIHKIRGFISKEGAHSEKLDLNVLIQEVVQLYANTLITKKISLSLLLQPDLSPVKGDRVRLQQVLMNLVSNAVEAMRQSPSRNLSILSTLRSPDTITVSVSDSGPGVDAKTKSEIFRPFYTTKKDGLGLGLRICRSIVEEHGGRIWMEESPAGGTTFSFSLKPFQENAI